MNNSPKSPKPKRAAPSAKKRVAAHICSHKAIAQRAYDIYISSGCQSGQCQQNWHQAEQELRTEGQAGGTGSDTDSDKPAPPKTVAASAAAWVPDAEPVTTRRRLAAATAKSQLPQWGDSVGI